MDPLSVTASIIAILQLSAEVLTYLNNVKDASKDRAQCAIEASNLYNLLVNLRFRLEEGDVSQPWYNTVQTLAVENGPLDQFKQALEILQTKMTDRGRLKQAGRALIWKFQKEEIASILSRMERLKTLIEIALQIDSFKLSQAIKDDTNFFRMHVPAIQTGINTIRQDQDSIKHRRLLDLISSTDYPAQQSDIIKHRQEGTGQWFLNAPEVARWLKEAGATLFCPGIPGAGKTMIAAIVIDHVLESTPSSSHGIAYVYCNYKSQKEQDASSILAAILKQLVQSRPSSAEPVERLYQQHIDRGTKPSLDEIYSFLRDVLVQYPAVHIVIDALDECRDGTRRKILSKFRDLQARTDVRLMVTSRFIPEVEEEFRGALKLEIRASNEDVKRFLAGQIYRLPRCIQRDLALQDLVQEKIVEAVDGMFLLARLHTDSLLDKRTPREIESTLARLLKGSAALDTAYKDAIQRIESQLVKDCERAKKVLSWITFAKRPLTTAEICCALAIDIGQVALDPKNVADVEDLVSVCAGLVVVDLESAVIRLVHYTTQEYFERIRDAWNLNAQSDIAKICLTYLSFNVFRSGSCANDKEFKDRLRQNQFLDYAAKHWGDHARAIEAEVTDLACSFLLEDGLVSCAEQVSLASSHRYPGYSQELSVGTNLHLAARFGLSRITQKLLSSLKDGAAGIINTVNKQNRTALSIAAEHGHNDLVKLLLGQGAEINAQGGELDSALQAASFQGHEQIVKLLLDKGADVNIQGGFCGNALQAALIHDYTQIAQLLLDNGADVNAQGGLCSNALQAASIRGHEQIVKLLLDHGAEVNAQGGHYSNALVAASLRGHKQTVKLLLDQGAEINALDEEYGNALQAASLGGHEQIVKLLLDQGAEVNAQGGHYSNALVAASFRGYEQTVKLLLNQGAEINAQDEKYGNALQAASLEGHEQTLKLLLNRGAEINARGGKYDHALQAASFKGHKQIVELLLDQGADVKSQGGFFGNALQAASYGGHKQIVKLLHEKGANM